jgi:hypothetical protein
MRHTGIMLNDFSFLLSSRLSCKLGGGVAMFVVFWKSFFGPSLVSRRVSSGIKSCNEIHVFLTLTSPPDVFDDQSFRINLEPS